MGCTSSVPAVNEPAQPAQLTTPPAATAAGGHLSRKLDRSAFPVWHPTDPLTQIRIDEIRAEFWQTRVTGMAEIWTTIKAAAEAVLNEDFELANAILEANLVQMQGGSLATCYDELGNQYQVPEYCFVPPSVTVDGSSTAVEPTGKAKLAGNEITVRIRLYPGEVKMALTISDGLLVSDLKKAIANQVISDGEKMDINGANQRMLYMGRELKDDQMIAVANIESDKIVQTYVRPVQR